MQAIEKHGEIRRIEGFFDEVERSTEQLSSETKSTTLERLALTRGLIGEVSALDSLIHWNTPEEILQAKTTKSSFM